MDQNINKKLNLLVAAKMNAKKLVKILYAIDLIKFRFHAFLIIPHGGWLVHGSGEKAKLIGSSA